MAPKAVPSRVVRLVARRADSQADLRRVVLSLAVRRVASKVERPAVLKQVVLPAELVAKALLRAWPLVRVVKVARLKIVAGS